MNKQYKVIVNTGKAENNQVIDVAQGAGARGQGVRIKAQAGAKYQLQEIEGAKNTAPEYIKVKRVGKNLHILFEDELEPSLIIEDYYEVMPEGYNAVVGQAENGNFYEYIPEDPDPKGLIPLLGDGGQAVNVALGGAEVVGSGAAVGVLAFNPLLAALGLAGAGAAVASTSTGDADPVLQTGTTPLPGTPVLPTGALDAGSDSGLKGDQKTNDNTPTLSGQVPVGSTAAITLNGQTYPVTVNADGSYTFVQPSALPDGTYTPVLQVTQNGVTTSTSLSPLVIDTTPPTVAISSDASTVRAGQSATLSFTLSEATDFGLADITVTGGTLSNFQQSAANPLLYTATFTPAQGASVVSVRVDSNAVADAAGNLNADGSDANNVWTAAVTTEPVVQSPVAPVAATGGLDPVSDSANGSTPNDNKTSDSTPVLSGKVPAGTTAASVLLGGQSWPVSLGADGTWRFVQPVDLPEGTHYPVLQVITNGVTSVSPLTPFTIEAMDTTAPAKPAAPASYGDNVGDVQSAGTTAPVTDDNTPALNIGTVPAGTTPALYVDGQKVPATYNPATGTLTPTTPLADGPHQLAYTLTDAAGNESPLSNALPVTVDTTDPTKPAAPASYGDNLGDVQSAGTTAPVTDDNTPALNIGNVPEGTTPTLYVDGQEVPATYNPATGTLTPTTPLADGPHQLAYTLTDAAGNESPVSNALPVTVDTNAPAKPATPVSYGDNVGDVQSAGTTAPITDDNTPALNIGTVPAGTTPALYVDGQEVPATYNPATGTLTPTTPLADGPHQLAYTLSDAAGNESPLSNALPLTVDTSPSNVDNTAPSKPGTPTTYADNAGDTQSPTSTAPVTDDNTPALNIGTVPAGTTPTLYVDGQEVPATYNPATGTLTPTTPLADGPHQLAYSLTDAAGNESPVSNALPVTVDTTAPAKPATPVSYGDNVGDIQSPTSTAPVTDDNTPSLNVGTVPAGTTPALYVDGQEVPATYNPATGTLTPTTPLVDGPHQLAYTLTDAAGNESPVSNALPVTVDTTAPAKPATPASYGDNVGDVQSAGTTAPVTDDNTPALNIGAVPTGTTPTLYVDGQEVPATYNPATGTLTPTTPLADGPHQLAYSLTDAAGNESPVSNALPVTVDTTDPTKPATPASYGDNAGDTQSPTSTAPVTDDNTPSLNIGNVSEGTTPTLYVDGQEVPATYDPTTGTLTPTTPLADGSHQLAYTLTDAAGNESPLSNALPVTVDTTDPSKPATPTTYADNTGDVQSPTSTAPATDDTTPALNIGTVATGTTPTLYVDGQEVPATYDPTTGTLTPTTPLTEGPHQLAYSLTDAAGNESPVSNALPVTVDTNAPAKPAAPASYGDNAGDIQSAGTTAPVTDDTTPALNIGTVPTGTTPTLYVDGQEVPATYDPTTGTLTPTTPLTEGPHQLTYTLTDAAGNESPLSNALPVTVDTTPASADTTAPLAPTASINAAGTQLSGQAEPGATVTATLPDGTELTATADPNGDYSIALSPALTNGETVDVSASDAAGNASLPTDVTAPDSTDPTAPTASVAPNGSAVTGTAEPGATVTAYDESGKPLGSATADANGNYSIPLSPALTDGQTLDVVAQDAAGNASPATEASAPDSTAPTLAISSNQASLAAGQTATITFTLSEASADFAWDGSTGDIAVTGGSLSALTKVSDTVYTATFTPNANSSAAGIISVASGQFSDAAGNTNTDGADPNNRVTLTVNTVTSSFTVANDTNSATEDGPAISGNLLTNDSLATAVTQLNFAGSQTPVGSGAPATVVGSYGSLVLNANGTYTYTLDTSKSAVQALAAGQKVSEVFSYTATDGAGLKDAMLNITITGTNDAPLLNVPLSDQYIAVGSALSYTVGSSSFSDIDSGDSLSYSATMADGSALPDWLAFDALTRTFTGTFNTVPVLNLDAVLKDGVADIADGKAELLKINLTDLLQLPTTSDGQHVLQVIGDEVDAVELEGLLDGQPGTWTNSGPVTQNGHTYNVYQHSGDQTLQVLIDQHIATSNVHSS